ncbi:tyrosinase tyrosinase: common central domain protein, partial [Rhizoctonia solani AG-3 Rhs1AP]
MFDDQARINSYPGATLYDDFATVYMTMENTFLYVAQILPWNRWFVHLYETALKDCGYDGNAIYWDWTRDAGLHAVDSPIFDPVTGFGGSGTNISMPSPVATGPFVNFTVVVYGDYSGSKDYGRPHYLERQFLSEINVNNTIIFVPATEDGSMLSERYNESEMKGVMDGENYDSFLQRLVGGGGSAIHEAIGGDMYLLAAPNDPLYFLHYANVDRWWWKWQHLNNSANALQYMGTRVQRSGVRDATAQDLMLFMGLLGEEDLPVSDVLLTNSLKEAFEESFHGNTAKLCIRTLNKEPRFGLWDAS